MLGKTWTYTKCMQLVNNAHFLLSDRIVSMQYTFIEYIMILSNNVVLFCNCKPNETFPALASKTISQS